MMGYPRTIDALALDEAVFLYGRAREITADTRRTEHRQQKAREQAAKGGGHKPSRVR